MDGTRKHCGKNFFNCCRHLVIWCSAMGSDDTRINALYGSLWCRSAKHNKPKAPCPTRPLLLLTTHLPNHTEMLFIWPKDKAISRSCSQPVKIEGTGRNHGWIWEWRTHGPELIKMELQVNSCLVFELPGWTLSSSVSQVVAIKSEQKTVQSKDKYRISLWNCSDFVVSADKL